MTAPRADAPSRRPRVPEIALRVVPAPARPVGPPSPLVPNLLLAGVSHAGVTHLARALAGHPEVTLPVVHRIDHYSPLRFGQPVRASLADYDQRFANWRGERYRLERSPIYFDGGRELVDAVARDLPDLRVVFLLREPVERLWRGYRHKVARGRLPDAMSFQNYVERSMTLRANGTDRYEGNRYFRTLSSGMYVEHLGQWLAVFGSRARVLFVEDLTAAPGRAVADLLTWLDLDPQDRRHRDERGPAVIGGAGVGRATSVETGRRTRPVLPAPVDLMRRVARPWVPRQADRMRRRVEQVYARPNRELADLLSEAGCGRLPAWLTATASR